MELKKILKQKKFIKTNTNPIYLTAEEVGKLTGTNPMRWLRDVKNFPDAIKRAIIDFKEAEDIKNKPALFIYLFKKHKPPTLL